MSKLLAAFLCALYPVGATLANDMTLSFCGSKKGGPLAVMVERLERLDHLLPPVPPDDDKLLRDLGFRLYRETVDSRLSAKAATKLHDELVKQPYYYLRLLHLDLQHAKDALEYIPLAGKAATAYLASHQNLSISIPIADRSISYENPAALKLDHAGRVLPVFERLARDAQELIQMDSERETPILPASTRWKIEGLTSGYLSQFGYFIQCNVAGAFRDTQAK